MDENETRTEVAIAGGGLAGLTTALELAKAGRRVVVLDRDEPGRLGGLAAESFGGIFLVDTPMQRRGGIRDSVPLALEDWNRTAAFEDGDEWPRRWAEAYVNEAGSSLLPWLSERGVRIFPVVHWVERGLFQPGNSVPRFHMVWGTGRALVDALAARLAPHRESGRVEFRFRHRVLDLVLEGGRATGFRGTDEASGRAFLARAEHVVCAVGGISGDLDQVRRHWPRHELGEPPETLLNGSHRYADGKLLERLAAAGGRVTRLERMWNYAAGVHHPRPDRPHHGLSLVPPRSALWFDPAGRRIGPMPLVTGFDTRHLVEAVCRAGGWSWQVLNRRIAVRELAVSGSEFNDSMREKRLLAFLKDVALGNPRLVDALSAGCPDFVVAGSIGELVEKMNALEPRGRIDLDVLSAEIERYDAMIARGRRFHDDDQLRRIAHLRSYRGDRVRTCKFQAILDPRARPLLAIREFILTRKSLGGVQTDLGSRVLDPGGHPIAGLYAAGETAGFGGGGVHGRGSLEGTFLGGCIVTGRAAARTILAG